MTQPNAPSHSVPITADTTTHEYYDLLDALNHVGHSMRQHPRQNDRVRDAMARLMASLQTLLATRPQVAVVAQPHALTINGQCIEPQAAHADTAERLGAWIRNAGLESMTITAEVSREELEQFLYLVTMADGSYGMLGMLSHMRSLQLRHIHTTAQRHQQDLAVIPHEPLSQTPLPTPRVTPPADFYALRDEDWAYLRSVPREGVPQVRHRLLTKLHAWLAQHGDTLTPELAEQVDGVLAEFLRHEEPGTQLPLIVTLARAQVAHALRQDAWPCVVALWRAAMERQAEAPDAALRDLFAPITEQLFALPEYGTALRRAVQRPHTSSAMRELCQLTEGRAIAPLVTQLMDTLPPKEHPQLLCYLRQLGAQAQPPLLAALRTPATPEIARELLTLLGEVGTVAALPVIEGFLMQADAHLRAAALGAAMAIAREQGEHYLLQGLRDTAPALRCHAASLAHRCPRPPVLHAVLRLLARPLLRHGEPEDVQLAACLALRHFKTGSACRALIRIAHPHPLAYYRRKSDQVRAAAVLGLPTYYTSARAQQAIKRALTARSAVIRAAAQQAWEELLAKNQIDPTTPAPDRA